MERAAYLSAQRQASLMQMRLLTLPCLLALWAGPTVAQPTADISLIFAEMLMMGFSADNHCEFDVDQTRLDEARAAFGKQYGPTQERMMDALRKHEAEVTQHWDNRLKSDGAPSYCAHWLTLYGPQGSRFPGVRHENRKKKQKIYE